MNTCRRVVCKCTEKGFDRRIPVEHEVLVRRNLTADSKHYVTPPLHHLRDNSAVLLTAPLKDFEIVSLMGLSFASMVDPISHGTGVSASEYYIRRV